MFLKKIEINGFKSFAKPITINFNSTITAIIGPNGSGKSNIVDAIRWVFGEQSAKSLRGNKMSDVIFTGSDKHKPSKNAKVTLYLNNKKNTLSLDENVVTISREVNKNGESDYYINRSRCRLKDIESLFMDTGLGKDSYSIVSQGEITSLINNGPRCSMRARLSI
ncbi:MAG: AAA family ATPase [bacterium]